MPALPTVPHPPPPSPGAIVCQAAPSGEPAADRPARAPPRWVTCPRWLATGRRITDRVAGHAAPQRRAARADNPDRRAGNAGGQGERLCGSKIVCRDDRPARFANMIPFDASRVHVVLPGPAGTHPGFRQRGAPVRSHRAQRVLHPAARPLAPVRQARSARRRWRRPRAPVGLAAKRSRFTTEAPRHGDPAIGGFRLGDGRAAVGTGGVLHAPCLCAAVVIVACLTATMPPARAPAGSRAPSSIRPAKPWRHPMHVWTAPWMQERAREIRRSGRVRSCVRPVGAASWPLAQMGSAIQTQTPWRLREPVHETGSLDRRFDRLSSRFALLPRHRRVVGRQAALAAVPARAVTTRAGGAAADPGHRVQSRPKPRGGSIAASSLRSRSQIARSASAVALSCRLSGSASSQAA